jgi:hypothetical protein
MADGQGFCGLMCLFSSAQLYYVRQLVATQYPPPIRQRETSTPNDTTKLWSAAIDRWNPRLIRDE